MNASDAATITTVGVLAAAGAAMLAGFGVDVPLYIPAAMPIAAGTALFGLRLYVSFVGAENTTVDEAIAKVEAALADLRKIAGK